MRPTYAEIVRAIPYLTMHERGRLRHILSQPVPAIAADEPMQTTSATISPIMSATASVPSKVLRFREKNPPNSEN